MNVRAKSLAVLVLDLLMLGHILLAASVTAPLYDAGYVTHGGVGERGDGTYVSSSSARVGFEDISLGNDVTYKAWMVYALPYIGTVAVDRLSWTTTISGNQTSWDNFQRGRVVMVDGYNHMATLTNAAKWSTLGRSQNTFLFYAGQGGIVPEIGGTYIWPLETAARVIYSNRSSPGPGLSSQVRVVLGISEYPASTDSTWSNDSSFLDYSTQSMTVTYTGQPANLRTNNSMYASGDTLVLSWDADTSSTFYIGFRVQVSSDSSFPSTSTTTHYLTTAKSYSTTIGSPFPGRYYWRVQARNYMVDTSPKTSVPRLPGLALVGRFV